MIGLLPFPAHSRLRWRRLDVPGREEARIDRTAAGWRLAGDLQVRDGDVTARLRYEIETDGDWRTRRAVVDGEADARPARFTFTADGHGAWTHDGVPAPALGGALDLDLGFTPLTNTLPIRRLALRVGESAAVRTAWLRFPELRLELLAQTYTRDAAQVYRYDAMVDGDPFTARLETDEFGRVVRYEHLWQAE